MATPRTSPAAGEEAARRPGLLGFGPPRDSLEEAVRRAFAPHVGERSARDRSLFDAWRATMRLLRPLGAVSFGNEVEVVTDGDALFESMWEAIDGATRSVTMSTYTLEPDRVGQRTLRALADASARGCTVTFVYDAIGSFRLGEDDVRPLRETGARVVAYNPLLRWRRRSRLVRNHQKILVVDRELGFCGGMNVAEEYAGERHGTGLFRDTHLVLRGPCVADLAELALGVVGGEEERVARPRQAVAWVAGTLVQILESNVRRQRRAIQRALKMTVRRAQERCYLTTPYFVPSGRLMGRLKRAARRGVDVRILTAGRSDVPIVRLASQHLYGRLLRAGVRIYELQSGTLHAKTAAIDGLYASVGSFNLDHWSDRRNLEVNVSFLDAAMAGEIEDAFEHDLEGAREMHLGHWERRSPLQRALHWAAYQLMRI
jgi:cardiolipin synthase